MKEGRNGGTKERRNENGTTLKMFFIRMSFLVTNAIIRAVACAYFFFTKDCQKNERN